MRENWMIEKSGLADLNEKIRNGQRLNDEDALRLYTCPDLNVLGTMANAVNAQKNGNRASYSVNRDINYSNYCILSCQFCSFSRKKA
jgi:aminodeoxyfutalosine synthase